MRHFEQEELARRYSAYRPQVHTQVLQTLGPHMGSGSLALDVACGTGHSTAPLRGLAEHVVGCDVSEAMLMQARHAYADITFINAPAETLPLKDAEVDLITVGFAFHWFDQPAFLTEAARVLKHGGKLVIYNFWFPGEMIGHRAFGEWMRAEYLPRYPTPTRHRLSLTQLLAEGDYALTLVEAHELTAPVSFTAMELRNYLTTQSNVSAGLERGEALEVVDAWLDASLASLFQEVSEHFGYDGKVEVLERL